MGVPPALSWLLLLLLSGLSIRAGECRAQSSLHRAGEVAEAPGAFPDLGPAQAFSPSRFWWGSGAALAADAAALAALDRLWYADYERTRFHWHDDLDNWLQQDKLGHVVTALHVARAWGAYARWSGLDPPRAALYGGGLSLFFLSQIELLDGFSAGWGASVSDIVANAVGAGWGALHVADPRFRVVSMKWSYAPSPNRDRTAGLAANALKDYDGATFWIVVQPGAGESAGVPGWPAWLGLAVGHSGDGLAQALPSVEHPHHRVILLAPDIDAAALLEPLGPGWRLVGRALSFLHLPVPALQFTPGVRFHPIYF